MSDDVILSDQERHLIIDALHILATMVRGGADGVPGASTALWLDVARKLGGASKQVIVRECK